MELDDALTLVVFYLGAFLMPQVAARLHVPAAVAEMLYGLALSGSGLFQDNRFTELLGEFGFLYLMFLVGMEIDFNRVEREGKRTIFLGVAVAVLILACAAFVATRLELPFFTTFVLGAMSVGVLLVALVEANASQTRWGQVLLLVGCIGEFLTLMSLTAYDLLLRYGMRPRLLVAALEVLALFLVALLLLMLMKLLVWWFPHSFGRWVQLEDPSELGVRFGFVLMLSLAALAAWVELEAILGAFLAGLLLTYVFRETGVLETKLAALGQGFFVPIFFIRVGVNFDWNALGNISTVGKTLALLAGASLLVKLVPSLLLMLRGFSLRSVVAGSFLLATPLTLLVAIAAIGSEIGALDEGTGAAVILLAIVTGVLFPTAFKLIAPKEQPAG